MILRTAAAAIAAFCLGLMAVTGAAAQAPAVPAAPAAQPTAQPGVIASGLGDSASSAYILGRDDVVEVGLLGRTDYGGRARVQADGTIQLNMIGKIAAADRTTSELSETVRSALMKGGFFADPVVTVEVVGYASRYVTVLGAIGQPGLVPINRPYHLSEILARVGGVRDGAADYIVVRPEKGDEKRYLIRDLATGGVDQDPHVQPGDKIFVPTADLFYIYGKVNSPGSFPLTADMTLRMAIARGGGLAESGSDKKVDATRGGKKIKLKPDEKIEPGDVIVVGERLF